MIHGIQHDDKQVHTCIHAYLDICARHTEEQTHRRADRDRDTSTKPNADTKTTITKHVSTGFTLHYINEIHGATLTCI